MNAPFGGHKPRRFLISLLTVGLIAGLSGLTTGPGAAAAPVDGVAQAAPDPAPTASGWLFYKIPTPQPVCTGLGFNASEPSSRFYSRDDCGFAVFTLSEAATDVKVNFYGPDGGAPFYTEAATARTAANEYDVNITPTADWPAGQIRMDVVYGPDATSAGGATFGHNQLGATINVAPGTYAPGEDIPVSGDIVKLDSVPPAGPTTEPAPGAQFSLRLVPPTGAAIDVPGRITADANGSFSTTIDGDLTDEINAGPETGYKVILAVEASDATYEETATGAWAAKRAGAGAVTLQTPPTELLLENSFVSAVGWVKPGVTYPSRVFVRNLTDQAFSGTRVVVQAPAGTTFRQASPSAGAGSATISTDRKTISWDLRTVAAAPANGQTVHTLVIESQAATLRQDPQLVWKNLSTTATLTTDAGTSTTDRSHGPKVIPQDEIYDTARYGDRPFPVVPVDYLERKHLPSNSGDELAGKINSPDVEGSTFNLFQEMSLGQLFPQGTVPSSGIATRDFEYEPGFDFTQVQPNGVCRGATVPAGTEGSPVYPERIRDGFYQLPGNTEYYGSDKFGSALPGAIGGVGPLFDIDSACGPTGKLVYDSAVIADPEIDYSDYDTDKDGVVDFFMVVFAGCGGHGASQTGCGGEYTDAPYDNVWPHSSSLEFYYTDSETGQPGYVSDDQLKNDKGEKLYYTDANRAQMTTNETQWPVYVRVGPYNVNPETAIDKASVISHEYGHSLGLPDFYSLGGRETYGDWNLMATDKSQNMDIFSRQEMGWVVPEVLEPGTTPRVNGWTDSKQDTHAIKWQTRNGTPYTLRGPNVHNAKAFVAKLPGRQLIDPAKFDTGDKATKSHAWWSGSGNDFGCSPDGGHNLDVVVPGVQDLPEGSTVRLEFKSLWDIEWDYDYGFVLTSNNGGQEYVSHPSENGYTTGPETNPNANACKIKYEYGITGSSGSYQDGTERADRLLSNYPESVFLADSYDVTDLTLGEDEEGVIRFSYATDPGLARPGWFIDDIKVTATLPNNGGERVLLETDLEDEEEGGPDAPSFFPGGCKDDTTVATQCTPGWNYISSSAGSDADHAYYMELRDRSGFDENGKGENDRADIDFAPGLSLAYTDEAHGYGNTGGGNPPAQTPLDSQPQPLNDTPLLADAAWTAAAGDSRFSDSGKGHTDNYTNEEGGPWTFTYDCLTFDVLSMPGTDVGPSQSDGNLSGDVQFDVGTGCGKFDYGYVDEDGGGGDPEPPGPGNTAPRADAKVKPKVADRSRVFTFDARGSRDAETPNDLDYVWNFGDGGVPKDAVGPLVRHKFATPGYYRATVTVTDPRGATDRASVMVSATHDVQCAQDPVRRVGGWRHRHSHDAESNHYCVNDRDRKTKGDSLSMRFQGPRLDINYGKRNNGGSAVVILDGDRRGSVNFHNRSAQPRFGFVREFRGLGTGWHTVRLVVNAPQARQRFAYMDSFTVAGRARKPR
jgi:M6 family metalloprotease-like protein